MAPTFRSISTLSILIFSIIGCVIVGDTLLSGDTLNANEFIENGPYKFLMQSDCNLVLYLNENQVLWSSPTNGAAISCFVTLQNDGNLVILSGNNVVWNSGTTIGPNNYRLVVQADGNVVIYGAALGAALWATNTVQGGLNRKLL